jgi:hypothetical protein
MYDNTEHKKAVKEYEESRDATILQQVLETRKYLEEKARELEGGTE